MNDWRLPISKDKIIARRNRLIEYQKVGEVRFTPLYEAIDENILDINYMLHEIENLQSKIYRSIKFINSKHNWYGDEEEDNEDYLFELEDFEQLLDILKEDK